jgi:hypothetical protein
VTFWPVRSINFWLTSKPDRPMESDDMAHPWI